MERTHEVVIYIEEPNSDPGIMTEIGIVEEVATHKKIASIVYCSDIYSKNRQHTSLQKNGQFYEYEIQLDDLYLGLLKSNKLIFEALMMHETGHIIHGVFDKGPGGRETMEKRIMLIQQNKVAEEELLADQFAVEQCGKTIVLDMLNHVLSTRKKRGYDLNDVGIWEIVLRKRAVRQM